MSMTRSRIVGTDRQVLISARRGSHWRYLRSQVDAFIAAYHALPQPITDESCQGLVQRQKADNELRHQHSQRCIEWAEEQERIQEADMVAKRKKLFDEYVITLPVQTVPI